MSSNVFSKHSTTSQVCGILYLEKLPDNWRDIIDKYDYSGVVSQEHTPDDIDKKPHRHIIIKDLHGNKLSYVKVMELMQELNPDPAKLLVLSGGLCGLKAYCKYMIHAGAKYISKEQFNLENPLTSDFDMPKDGVMPDGCLNIYHDERGFYAFGSFDFEKYFQLTTRDTQELRRGLLNTQRLLLLDYILDNNIHSFRDLCIFARDNDLIDALFAFHSFYNNLISSQAAKKFRDDMLDKKTDYKSNREIVSLAFVSNVLHKYYGYIDPDLIDWFYGFNKSLFGGMNDKEIYKLFCKQVDMYKGEVRKDYYVQYKEWKGNNISDDYSQGVAF